MCAMWRVGGLTRDRIAESLSRVYKLPGRERGRGKIFSLCFFYEEQDWLSNAVGAQ